MSDVRRDSSAIVDRAALAIAFIVISAGYFYSAIVTAASKSLWMDEVLAVSASRLPSLDQVWTAIWNGAELSPPTYHFFLHALIQLTGAHDDRLVVRMPSIIAVYLAALGVATLIQRRFGYTAAVISLGAVLCSGLFDYAVQARQYGLLALGLAAALLIWDGAAEGTYPKLRAIALWLVLSICLSLHFYGVVIVATIGVAELLWFATRREFRLTLWLALIATVPVEAAWYPLASHLAAFNAGDNLASGYYAKPDFGIFIRSLFDLLTGAMRGTTVLLEFLLLFGGAYLLKQLGLVSPNADAAPDPGDEPLSRFGIIVAALCALPIIAFCFSVFVTKSFSARYMSEVALLSGIAVAYIWSRWPARDITAPVLISLLAILNFHPERGPDSTQAALASLDVARPPLPIVVGEGLLYIELMEAADPQTRGRLVYLLRPPGAISPDPTNENEVTRIASFHPEYKVSDQASFLAANADFYVLARPTATVDTTTPSLLEKRLLGRPLMADRGILIFRAGRKAATDGAIPPG